MFLVHFKRTLGKSWARFAKARQFALQKCYCVAGVMPATNRPTNRLLACGTDRNKVSSSRILQPIGKKQHLFDENLIKINFSSNKLTSSFGFVIRKPWFWDLQSHTTENLHCETATSAPNQIYFLGSPFATLISVM